ncbi:MAG: hypothetical protein M3P37_06765 [Actinomycetota bacterium]|nr:hypothetical protein [Actinomycetota bacterium]
MRDPAATERALAERVAKLDAKRERLLDLAADGILGKADLTARLSGVDAERRGFERELARVAGAAERVAEMEHQKRLLVEAFGTGLKLGVAWMPPGLRREVYEALGLRVTVSEDGAMWAEARVDEATIRYSRESSGTRSRSGRRRGACSRRSGRTPLGAARSRSRAPRATRPCCACRPRRRGWDAWSGSLRG